VDVEVGRCCTDAAPPLLLPLPLLSPVYEERKDVDVEPDAAGVCGTAGDMMDAVVVVPDAEPVEKDGDANDEAADGAGWPLPALALEEAAKDERPSSEESEEGERDDEEEEEEGEDNLGSVATPAVLGLPSAKLRICCATADSRPSKVWRRNTSEDGFPSPSDGECGDPPPPPPSTSVPRDGGAGEEESTPPLRRLKEASGGPPDEEGDVEGREEEEEGA
jgi:hypothetical protein